ncbi:trihelix transcription factor PTL-like [Salvia divinorum]|uniref:Trihelix transcription factor PTL-like n=1 Tax=Salvia divinorum TaxID=28513 RepID=A0ABD1GEB1_SALDI
MEDQYGMGDLRQYIDGRPHFPAISQPPDLLSCHRSSYPYDMLIFRPSDATDIAPSAEGAAVISFDGGLAGGGDGGAGRWPRQETLTLLEIRSRLDPKFKEANQKSPLWDEISRIMSQEHGYQRSSKKCREKFENLYKYYKKTKEGKAGRQDGKHYRFFRQLEALYGSSTSNSSATHFHSSKFNYNFPSSNNQEHYPLSKISATSLPDSCDCDATSSHCTDSNADDARVEKRRGKMRNLKAKIEASIEAQMRSMMEKQEAWMEKMTRAIEGKEQERLVREEQWRQQDAARIDGEHKMWAAEKAWIEARDAALMDAFNKLAAPENEVTRLIQLRSGMELNGIMSEELGWDEIGGGLMCRERWDHVINDYLIKCSKRKKEGIAKGGGCTYAYDQNRGSISDHGGGGGGAVRLHDNGNAAAAANDGLFRYFIGDSYQRL